jgi:hypothetical protein
MTKRIHRTLLIPAILAAAAASAQTIQVNQNNRTIAVTVTDKATAEADIATVHIGFETYAPDANTAYAAGSQTSNAIIDALRKSGVEDKAIESDGQSLRRTQFDDSDKETEADRAKKQFTLTQSWTVKCGAPEVAKVLHTAIEAGANTSGQVDWDLRDRSGLQAQAATKALQHAQMIANQMATGLSARIGTLMYASNQAPFQRLNSLATVNAEAASLQAMPAPPPPLVIRPQQIEESASVYAVFQIQ